MSTNGSRRVLEWWARRLVTLPAFVGAGVLFALMVLTFADVVLRGVANAPIPGAAELTRLAVAIIVFSALPLVSLRGEHITVDLLDGVFPRSVARLREALVSLGCGSALCWPGMRCLELAARERGYQTVTEYLAIPTFLISYAIAAATLAAAAMLCVRAALVLMSALPAGNATSEPSSASDERE